MADTFQPEVARAALDAGAVAINDISGGSEEMFELVAERGCGYVLMHIEGPPRVDRTPPVYDDVVEHVKAWFAERIERMPAAGVAAEQIAIDPGPDFDKGVDDTDRAGGANPGAPGAWKTGDGGDLTQGLPGRGHGRLVGGAARTPTSAARRRWRRPRSRRRRAPRSCGSTIREALDAMRVAEAIARG